MNQPYNAKSGSGLSSQLIHSPSQPETENRGAARFSVEQAADILLTDGKYMMACTILNVSRTGALIKLEKQKLPSHFILSVDGHDLYQSAHKVWVKGNLAGIRFFQELAAVPDFASNRNALFANEEASDNSTQEASIQPNAVTNGGDQGSPSLVPHKSFKLPSSPGKVSTGGFGKRRNSPK